MPQSKKVVLPPVASSKYDKIWAQILPRDDRDAYNESRFWKHAYDLTLIGDLDAKKPYLLLVILNMDMPEETEKNINLNKFLGCIGGGRRILDEDRLEIEFDDFTLNISALIHLGTVVKIMGSKKLGWEATKVLRNGEGMKLLRYGDATPYDIGIERLGRGAGHTVFTQPPEGIDSTPIHVIPERRYDSLKKMNRDACAYRKRTGWC